MRLYIDNDLKLTYKVYKTKPFEIESWTETINRNIEKLIELENESITLIKEKIQKYKNHKPIILTSGGKDSSVTMYLVREIMNSQAMFNNTSLDCADTYLHIKSLDNIMTTNPKTGFYQWVKTDIIPTRFSRGCCRIFKEGEMISNLDENEKYIFFMGMRNQESAQRSEYQDEWVNDKWANRDWVGILPIRKWSEEEVWLYILLENIDINPKYKKGYSRVGCAIACPFYTKSTWILDKYWYPTMYNRWHRILEEDFINNSKWLRLNCTLEEYHMNWNGGLVRPEPTDEVVEEFAKYKGLDKDIARKYFNKTCFECGKNIKTKNEIAMNLKFNGRNTLKLFCKKHLMEQLSIDKKKWDEYIEEFKNQGCSLF